jgi:hypothetical protein
MITDNQGWGKLFLFHGRDKMTGHVASHPKNKLSESQVIFPCFSKLPRIIE